MFFRSFDTNKNNNIEQLQNDNFILLCFFLSISLTFICTSSINATDINPFSTGKSL